MAKVLISDQYLINIGNAIRAKNGSNNTYTPSQMAPAIQAIETIVPLQTKTITPTTAEQTITPDTGYDGFSSVTINAVPTASQAVPQVSINVETGLITATANQLEGYVDAGTKRGTLQLTTKGETTITPSSTDQYITAGTYLTGLITVTGLNDGDNSSYGTTTAVSQVLITKTKLDALASAIKNKASSSTLPMTIAEMQNAVASIRTSSQMNMQTKQVQPNEEMKIITPDSGYDGLSSVQVNAVNASELNVTSNGIYTPASGAYYNRVIVNTDSSTEFNLQTKQITPTTSAQSVTPDEGYNGLSSVTVNAIPSRYADISGLTISVGDVMNGVQFIDSTGTTKTGTLQVNSYYVNSAIPDSSIGQDGDLYLKI